MHCNSPMRRCVSPQQVAKAVIPLHSLGNATTCAYSVRVALQRPPPTQTSDTWTLFDQNKVAGRLTGALGIV